MVSSMLDMLGSFSLPYMSSTIAAIILVSLKMWMNIVSSTLRLRRFRSEISHRLRRSHLAYKTLDKTSAPSVFNGWRSQVRVYLSQGQNEVELYIKLLPMLGLLGTVDGMIDCFAKLGENDILHAVSTGISQAMFSTLAGLLSALSGMYFIYWLGKQRNHCLSIMNQAVKSYEN